MDLNSGSPERPNNWDFNLPFDVVADLPRTLQALITLKIASSAEFVGKLWLGKLPEIVI